MKHTEGEIVISGVQKNQLKVGKVLVGECGPRIKMGPTAGRPTEEARANAERIAALWNAAPDDTEQAVKYLEHGKEMEEAAKELAEYTSYAEIVGAIGENRSAIRKWCDKVFAILKKLEANDARS